MATDPSPAGQSSGASDQLGRREVALTAWLETRNHLRHIEAERRYLLAAIAAVGAAALIFIGQADEGSVEAVAVALIAGTLSGLGLLASLRDLVVQALLEARTHRLARDIAKQLNVPDVEGWLVPATKEPGDKELGWIAKHGRDITNNVGRRRQLVVAVYAVGVISSSWYVVANWDALARAF